MIYYPIILADMGIAALPGNYERGIFWLEVR